MSDTVDAAVRDDAVSFFDLVAGLFHDDTVNAVDNAAACSSVSEKSSPSRSVNDVSSSARRGDRTEVSYFDVLREAGIESCSDEIGDASVIESVGDNTGHSSSTTGSIRDCAATQLDDADADEFLQEVLHCHRPPVAYLAPTALPLPPDADLLDLWAHQPSPQELDNADADDFLLELLLSHRPIIAQTPLVEDPIGEQRAELSLEGSIGPDPEEQSVHLFDALRSELEEKLDRVRYDPMFRIHKLPPFGTTVPDAYDAAVRTVHAVCRSLLAPVIYFGITHCARWRMLEAPYRHVKRGMEYMYLLFQGDPGDAAALETLLIELFQKLQMPGLENKLGGGQTVPEGRTAFTYLCIKDAARPVTPHAVQAAKKRRLVKVWKICT